MSNGYVIPIDPSDFSRFTGYDPRDEEMEFLTEEETLEREALEALEEEDAAALFQAGDGFRSNIDQLLEKIPDREADIISMYFVANKRQADIAAIFRMTQAAVSYRLARGIKRIRFLIDIPNVTSEEMIEHLSEVFPSVPPKSGVRATEEIGPDNLHVDVHILVNMWITTCQSQVAKELGLTQGRVRFRFFKAVKRLQEAAEENPKYAPYSDIFTKISSKRFNILREVKLPQWAGRDNDVLD